MPPDKREYVKIWVFFSYLSTKAHVVGTQKNRLDETVLSSTKNTSFKLMGNTIIRILRSFYRIWTYGLYVCCLPVHKLLLVKCQTSQFLHTDMLGHGNLTTVVQNQSIDLCPAPNIELKRKFILKAQTYYLDCIYVNSIIHA